MKTVCNWYHPEILLHDDGKRDGLKSHGLCDDCGERLKREIEDMKTLETDMTQQLAEAT